MCSLFVRVACGSLRCGPGRPEDTSLLSPLVRLPNVDLLLLESTVIILVGRLALPVIPLIRA